MNKQLLIKQELWRRGELSWLLYDHQRPVYDKIRIVLVDPNPAVNSHYLNISRQYGKSFTLFLIAVEQCLRNEGYTVCYIAPMKSQALEIVTQRTFNTIFKDCPPNLMPKLNAKAELEFANGSRIRISGSDNRHYESLRGGASNLNILDESGFMDNLIDGVIPSIEPMLKTTRGKMIYASTPAANMDHDSEIIYKDHVETDQVTTFTLYDDKQATPQDIERAINQCKGANTTKFKREYLCQHISDSSKQVIPELTAEIVVKSTLPNNSYISEPMYNFWKKYVVLDWGGKDKTAILFAHFNYKTKKVVIESHLDLVGTDVSLDRIARAIKERTDELWTQDARLHPISYYCDSNNVLAANQMIVEHGLPFVPTSKGSLDAMVQKVRDWFYDERIEFAPAALFALKSAESAHWVNNREKFAQSKVYGHYDHLAALVYLIRNVDDRTNPIPMLSGINRADSFVMPHVSEAAQRQNNQLASIFNPRKNSSYR